MSLLCPLNGVAQELPSVLRSGSSKCERDCACVRVCVEMARNGDAVTAVDVLVGDDGNNVCGESWRAFRGARRRG